MSVHVLVWLERPPRDAAVGNETLAALALASRSGGTVSVVAAVEKDETLTDEVVAALARHGARRIVCLRAGSTGPEARGEALAWALQQPSFAACPVTDLVATANACGRDVLARVSARLNAPLLQDCVAVDFAAATGEKYLLQGRTRGVYRLPGPLRCWTLRPHAFLRSEEASAFREAAERLELEAPAGRPRVRVSEKAREVLGRDEADPLAQLWAEQPDITEAAVVIGGGRALGAAENFRLLHEAAAPLHAAVGASRSAVDLGYAPPSAQIGQTGLVVSPELYLACGIFGSIFHTTGIKGARTVVAVNTDPGAPIFLRADYGLTDDLFAVLPILRRLLVGA